MCRERERLKGKDPFKDRGKGGPKGPPVGKSTDDDMSPTGGGICNADNLYNLFSMSNLFYLIDEIFGKFQ